VARRRSAAAFASFTLAAAGIVCAHPPCCVADPDTAAPSGALSVFAAASTTAAFTALARAFEQQHPGTTVQLNFAGSSVLARQIQEGAPADVFASADEATMQRLVDSGDAAAVQIFARNRLRLIVAPGNPKRIGGLCDLAGRNLQVALCARTVPCGRYAAQAFAAAGIAVPPASAEVDVKAVLSKVAMGEADAGIVYTTDVRDAGNRVTGMELPVLSRVDAPYPVAVLRHAADPTAANRFVAFVLSADGQRLLAQFGFLPR